MCLVALLAGGAWLAIKRSFVDITALPIPEAMAAQAAWVQAILSIAAVLVAVAVAVKQSWESRRLADIAHNRTIELLESDMKRKARHEIWLRKSRQRLAMNVLRPLNKSLLHMVIATEHENSQSSAAASKEVDRTAAHVTRQMSAIRNYLEVDAASALTVMKLFEHLGAAEISGTALWFSKVAQYDVSRGVELVSEVSSRDFARINASYIRLLQNIVGQAKRL
jgi:hypothetical protein